MGEGEEKIGNKEMGRKKVGSKEMMGGKDEKKKKEAGGKIGKESDGERGRWEEKICKERDDGEEGDGKEEMVVGKEIGGRGS